MKLLKKSCDLKTCLLCRRCLPDWIPAVDAHKKNYEFAKGERIFTEGEQMNGIYFIYTGTVKVHKCWGNDKELIVRFAKDGEIFGHRGMGKDYLLPVSATALEPTSVCHIDNNFFQSSLRVNHEFLYELMLFYASELKESEMNMRNLAHMQVKNRIAQALLSLMHKFGTNAEGEINIILSRQDLSSFVGTSYETLFRMLNDMSEEKLIAHQGKRIRILDTKRLNELAGNLT